MRRQIKSALRKCREYPDAVRALQAAGYSYAQATAIIWKWRRRTWRARNRRHGMMRRRKRRARARFMREMKSP